jgi:hypothetical protein
MYLHTDALVLALTALFARLAGVCVWEGDDAAGGPGTSTCCGADSWLSRCAVPQLLRTVTTRQSAFLCGHHEAAHKLSTAKQPCLLLVRVWGPGHPCYIQQRVRMLQSWPLGSANAEGGPGGSEAVGASALPVLVSVRGWLAVAAGNGGWQPCMAMRLQQVKVIKHQSSRGECS